MMKTLAKLHPLACLLLAFQCFVISTMCSTSSPIFAEHDMWMSLKACFVYFATFEFPLLLSLAMLLLGILNAAGVLNKKKRPRSQSS